MLARLALAPGGELGREALIEELWPGVELEVGRNRLRQVLSSLRSGLSGAVPDAVTQWAPDWLQADRRVVRLRPGSLTSDVITALRARKLGDRAPGTQLESGEFMPGFFDQWVIEERRRLEALLSDQAAPQPAAVSTAALPRRLPSYLSRRIGLDDDALSLARAVQQHRLVVLRGPGGAGKTRLAAEVAQTLASGAGSVRFDLVAFAGLAACHELKAMEDTVWLALQQEALPQIAARGPHSLAEQLAHALAGRRALLVIDNFEQLVDVGRQSLAEWLDQVPGLHLLVTSRRALGLDGEHQQPLMALAVPAPDASQIELSANPAVMLFVDRAAAASPGFALNEHNAQPLAAVVRALQGLPLALELAAARLRSVSLNDMLAMLLPSAADAPAGSLALLARNGPRGTRDDRHASMTHVLQWSWQHLSPPEQQLLASLVAFDGGASLGALQSMVGEGAASTAARLDALVAASVAYLREGQLGDGRYHAYEPMREYVLSQLGPQALHTLRLAHLNAMAAWGARVGHNPELHRFRDELPNLLAAWRRAAAMDSPGSRQRAMQLAWDCRHAVSDVLIPSSGLIHLRALLQRHEPSLGSSWDDVASQLHALLASQSFEAGQADQARWHSQQALRLAAPDSTALAHALQAAARVSLRIDSDLASALQHIEQGQALAQRLEHYGVLAQLLTMRAVIAVRSEHDFALDLALKQRALALQQAQGAGLRVAAATIGVALSLGFLRRWPEQLDLVQRAREMAQAQGQRSLHAFCLSVEGYVLADLRRWEESRRSYLRCLEEAWQIGAWREWFYALWNLPRTLACQGQPELAAQLMGFASAFYAQRYGPLGWEDLRECRRTQRLVRARIGAAAASLAWQQGQMLSNQEVMALARTLGSGPATPAAI